MDYWSNYDKKYFIVLSSEFIFLLAVGSYSTIILFKSPQPPFSPLLNLLYFYVLPPENTSSVSCREYWGYGLGFWFSQSKVRKWARRLIIQRVIFIHFFTFGLSHPHLSQVALLSTPLLSSCPPWEVTSEFKVEKGTGYPNPSGEHSKC